MCNSIKAVEIIGTENGKLKLTVEITCDRCYGEGYLKQYTTTNGGVCFKCEGTGVNQVTQTVSSDIKVEIVKPSQVKARPMPQKVNDDVAMRNAMLRINEEHKARRQAWKEQEEKDRKEIEELEDLEPFTWD